MKVLDYVCWFALKFHRFLAVLTTKDVTVVVLMEHSLIITPGDVKLAAQLHPYRHSPMIQQTYV